MQPPRFGPARGEVTRSEIFVTHQLGARTAIPLHALPPDAARIILKDLAPRQLHRFGVEGVTYYLMGPRAFEELMQGIHGPAWREQRDGGAGPHVVYVDGGPGEASPVQPSVISVRREGRGPRAVLRSRFLWAALVLLLAVLLHAMLPRYVPAGSGRVMDRWTGELCGSYRGC